MRVLLAVASLLMLGTVCMAGEPLESVLEGKRFESVNEYVFGLSSYTRARQSVFFDEHRWHWRHSDLQESGTFTMDEAGDIVASGALGGKDIHAHFDRETNELTWAGEQYTLVRPVEPLVQEGDQGGGQPAAR